MSKEIYVSYRYAGNSEVKPYCDWLLLSGEQHNMNTKSGLKRIYEVLQTVVADNINSDVMVPDGDIVILYMKELTSE